jgi:hypothetical protein
MGCLPGTGFGVPPLNRSAFASTAATATNAAHYGISSNTTLSFDA